jgi:oxygen-independent coproporphyrinogen-3 oxidase
VHLPWCLRKCPYCDFNSHEIQGSRLDPALERDYLAALQVDLESSLPLVWGRRVETVFIGGGTPSLFSPAGIDALLTMVRARLSLAADAEITLEANPGTFERQRFADFAAAGVTRLSIGVQSFDDERLRALGRVHDASQAIAAVELAAARFRTYNVDLMFALPGQALKDLRREIGILRSIGPPHVSWYHLTLEPNTLFARFPPSVPDEDLAAAMHDEIEQALAAEGYGHYEVSAYARPGHRARHNLNYWQFGDYLGIGAGAHGKLSFHDRIERQARYRHPRRYMEAAARGDAVEERRRVGHADLGFEFMLNAMRLRDGVPVELFAQRTGCPIGAIGPRIEAGVARGLLDPDPTLLRPTPLGWRFLNDLQGLFL